MKQLSARERKRRRLLKMYKSLENQLSPSNKIWWDSLTLRARYSFLFKWQSYKSHSPNKKLKHFISETKISYKPSLSNQRNAIIEHLIK